MSSDLKENMAFYGVPLMFGLGGFITDYVFKDKLDEARKLMEPNQRMDRDYQFKIARN